MSNKYTMVIKGEKIFVLKKIRFVKKERINGILNIYFRYESYGEKYKLSIDNDLKNKVAISKGWNNINGFFNHEPVVRDEESEVVFFKGSLEELFEYNYIDNYII